MSDQTIATLLFLAPFGVLCIAFAFVEARAVVASIRATSGDRS